MKGFVLAAGFGQRLRPLTESVPKPLLPVGNVPLIGYALRLLAHHGITDVGVNAHHLARVLMDTLGSGGAFGVEITWSEEEEEILGTGGGLKRMQDFLSDGTFVVVNSDTVLDIDLTAVIEQHQEHGALATMVLRQDARQAEFGQIEVDSSGRIRKILGQGDATDEPLKPYMFAGVHIIEPQFLDYIPPGVNTCINRYAYPKALRNGAALFGAVMDGYWADAGTPARYLQCNVDALEHRADLRHVDPLGGFALAPTHKKADVEVVRMGEGVQLGTDARLMPPVILGDGTKVGDKAVVGPHVVVGQRAVIGKEAQVSEAVVMDGSKIEAGAHIHNTLVCRRGNLEIEDFEKRVDT